MNEEDGSRHANILVSRARLPTQFVKLAATRYTLDAKMGARSPQSTGPIRVFVAGTFDGLHRGHVFLLDFARRYGLRRAQRGGRNGAHLTVVIARDDSVRRIKGRLPHHSERERQQLVAALKTVDRARLGFAGDFLRSVRTARPDVIVLGYDQSARWETTLREAGFKGTIVRCPAYSDDRLKSSRMRADFMRRET